MKQKIFLLEDESLLGQIYKKKLETFFEVKWVTSLDHLIDEATSYFPDLIILDHGIRGEKKTGSDFILDLKKHLPKAKIVILSNYSQFELEEKALRMGAEKYLLKIDTSPQVLLDVCKELAG